METNYLKFIAEIMGTDEEEISMDTAYGEFEKWDSMMMLTLVMEVEQEYGVSIPIEKMNEIHTLKDLYEYTR